MRHSCLLCEARFDSGCECKCSERRTSYVGRPTARTLVSNSRYLSSNLSRRARSLMLQESSWISQKSARGCNQSNGSIPFINDLTLGISSTAERWPLTPLIMVRFRDPHHSVKRRFSSELILSCSIMTFDSKVKLGLGIFAAALFALCIGGMVYSFFKPVTDPNAPEPPQPFSAPACSAECKLSSIITRGHLTAMMAVSDTAREGSSPSLSSK